MVDTPPGATLRVERSDDPVGAAATALAHRLETELSERGRVRLAIPGGSALDALAPARDALGDRWSAVQLTWVDERCVPASDPESNRGEATRRGLLEPPAPRDVLPLFEDDEAPEAAVKRSRAALAARFESGLDVLLLGMGEDGHIASLFPSLPLPEDGDVAWVRDSPKPPADRITLTPRLLATARTSVLLATGKGKREALARLVAGDASLPASGLRGLHVVTDQEVPDA